MGCRYCEWACPYGAPQFDAARGVMTKCDLCADRLEEGLRAVVRRRLPDARPRLRDARRDGAPVRRGRRLPAPRPAADGAGAPADAPSGRAALGGGRRRSRTSRRWSREGGLARRLHAPDAGGGRDVLGSSSRSRGARSGRARALPWRRPRCRSSRSRSSPPCSASRRRSSTSGTPGTPWRALGNLRSSWLSREILLAALFTAALAAATLLRLRPGPAGFAAGFAHGFAAVAGFGLVVTMARAYRLRTVPLVGSARDAGRLLRDGRRARRPRRRGGARAPRTAHSTDPARGPIPLLAAGLVVLVVALVSGLLWLRRLAGGSGAEREAFARTGRERRGLVAARIVLTALAVAAGLATRLASGRGVARRRGPRPRVRPRRRRAGCSSTRRGSARGSERVRESEAPRNVGLRCDPHGRAD